MDKYLGRIFNYLLKIPAMVTPAYVKKRADTERYGIDEYVNKVISPDIRKQDRVLDAGAGSFRYRKELSKGIYESTDFEDVFDKSVKGKHTFICNLDSIPVADNSYDVVVNTQVIEHVPNPEKVISELARVLKPSGRLYLTTPQISPVHGAPYNFFFFTNFGLKMMFENAGLEVVHIKSRGGIFWVFAQMLKVLPSYFYYQYAFTGFKMHIGFKPKIRSKLRAIIFLPFYIFSEIIIGYWIPFIFFYLDKLDKQKIYSLGYVCFCRKKN